MFYLVLVAAAKYADSPVPDRPGACLRAQSTGSVGVWVPWQACEAVRCCPEDVTSLISVLNLHKCKLVSAGLDPEVRKNTVFSFLGICGPAGAVDRISECNPTWRSVTPCCGLNSRGAYSTLRSSTRSLPGSLFQAEAGVGVV